MDITKEKEPFEYNLVGLYQINDIVNIVSSFNLEWEIDTARQNQTDGTHRNTEYYMVLGALPTWDVGKNPLIIKHCKNEELWDLLQPIFKDLENYHDGVVVTAMIVKLFAEKDVLPHKDEGSNYFGAVRRHHMAIKTNPSAKFFINDIEKHMKVGELWEINNNRVHYATNDGDLERIHIIIDIIPNKYLAEK
jgi:hypothetical protein